MLSADIAKYLENNNGQAPLYAIQIHCGYPRAKYGNVPDTNPVNRELVAMIADGTITTPKKQWGEPDFFLVKKG